MRQNAIEADGRPKGGRLNPRRNAAEGWGLRGLPLTSPHMASHMPCLPIPTLYENAWEFCAEMQCFRAILTRPQIG